MTATHSYGTAPRKNRVAKGRATDSALRKALRRNVYAASGLLGLLLCAAVAGSLATWNVTDPSLSNATDLIPRNILGMPGAIVSDLMLQTFGLGSAFLLIAPVIWFWRLVRLEPMRFSRKRLMAWIGSLGTIAIAFATIPAPSSWPLPLSLGGMIGDGFLSLLNRIDETFLQGIGALIVGTLFSAVGVLLMLNAADTSLFSFFSRFRRSPRGKYSADAENQYSEEGIDYSEEEDFEAFDDDLSGMDQTSAHTRKISHPSVVIGAVSHWWLSLKAKLTRRPAQRAGQKLPFRAKLKSWLLSQLQDDDDGLVDLQNRIDPSMHQNACHHETPDYDDGDFVGDRSEYAAYEEDIPWDQGHSLPDQAPVSQQAVSHGQAIGVAAPSQPQAVTNDQVQPKRVRVKAGSAKGGKRMVPSEQGNLFTRREEYQFPPMNFLAEPKTLGPNAGLTAEQLEHNARLLEGVLSDFGVRGEIIKVRPGPVVTLYELEPAPGIKSSRVIGLADDIARSMSAISARVAVVPGRNAIGIELPNAKRETVFLRELLVAKEFEKSKFKLPICLGKNIGGDPVIADLARMPHVLVAGTTGSGKSVSINTTIMSLLYRHTPEECRLIMIDPKMLELSIYDGIPHLLTPVVTDPSKAVVALKWAVREMEQRYKNMSKMGVRNIDGFNSRVRQSLAKGEQVTRTIQTGFDPETGDPIFEQEELDLKPMPYIVIIVDEMADLMMVAGKDIEGAIQRLAQMARAAGIHLIMATQRPSVDVITGTIKANFPTRMSFQVTSKIDSRTILGEMGAEQLLGMGDMLYMAGGGRTQRVHGPFVSDEEVESVVSHLKLQGTPDYLEAVTEDTESEDAAAGGSGSGGGSDAETLYDKAVDIVLRDRKASTSYIQRRLSIGYNRAATLIEQMEQQGVIGPANHAGKREILVPEEGATM